MSLIKIFEELKDLSPEEYTRRRAEIIEEFLEASPPELRQLQWRIEGIRRRDKDPLRASAAMLSEASKGLRDQQKLNKNLDTELKKMYTTLNNIRPEGPSTQQNKGHEDDESV
jgi:hypothetical protein